MKSKIMYLHLKVKTEAKREEVKQISVDHYEISIKEKAVRNMANRRILEIMENLFPNKQIRIINGHHSPSKLIAID